MIGSKIELFFVVDSLSCICYTRILEGKESCEPGPEVIKINSCSTQLSMNFFLLINVKMPTIVGILTFMSRKNSILGVSATKEC